MDETQDFSGCVGSSSVLNLTTTVQNSANVAAARQQAVGARLAHRGKGEDPGRDQGGRQVPAQRRATALRPCDRVRVGGLMARTRSAENTNAPVITGNKTGFKSA